MNVVTYEFHLVKRFAAFVKFTKAANRFTKVNQAEVTAFPNNSNRLFSSKISYLTRAPLGYFYNAPHWGGGYFGPPPL